MALMDLTEGLAKAREDFAKGDPLEMWKRSHTVYNQEKSFFELDFLGDGYQIDYPDGKVHYKGSEDGDAIGKETQILLLHYLAHASGIPLQDRLISFKELDNGFLYIGPFTNRAIVPLVKIFGDEPARMVSAAKKIGGKEIDLGDVAVTIPAFPLLPVTCVIWEGDDEFPASGNILFDGSAGTHLATEDFAFLAGMLVFKLRSLSE
ncbi:MAG TPA: DUF3786 domain-containing protein [Clostridia bacterium]|nr:DUF3786 domain-containing protein [Clostridia bacterium]